MPTSRRCAQNCAPPGRTSIRSRRIAAWATLCVTAADGVKIRTAIFTVYVAASAVAFVALLTLVLRDVRLRYIESMRRTLGDTAAFLAVLAAEGSPAGDAWV